PPSCTNCRSFFSSASEKLTVWFPHRKRIGASCRSSEGPVRLTICQFSSRSSCLPIHLEKLAQSRGLWFQLASRGLSPCMSSAYSSLFITTGLRPRARNSSAKHVSETFKFHE